MASIAISASLPRASNSNHVSMKKKQRVHLAKPGYSSTTKNPTPKVISTLDVVNRDDGAAQQYRRGNAASAVVKEEEDNNDDWNNNGERFTDKRWKNGTWDLNMFVQNGKMDWEGVIVEGECISFL